MVELMFAMGVLAVAILGGMAMIIIGMGRNGGNRMDTTATNVAQTVLEDIASVSPNANPAPTLNINDCQGTLQVNTAPGGSLLDANGNIDFQQGVVAGYQATYNMCVANGPTAPYDVRWNVQIVQQVGVNTFAKLVTVAARQPLAVRNGTIFYTPPVTLRTIVGM
jgi:hypothetical protein